MTTDYRATVFLPKTEFGMRARLPRREPEILARWQRDDLFARLREAARGREKFILHDGPPYANGHLHIGHALNKILKDVINRSQQMLGRDANYVPGWDCHGLPIEWTIEEKYRAEGRDKDQVPLNEFRRECREFAAHWIEVQREEFERLGVLGDWENPYTTMSYDAEAQIVRELGKFLMNGGLYLGAKPVLWSVVEKTALAEAEVEYLDHESTTVHVRFPVARPSHEALAGACALIWTTTPWTIPGNRAIAFGEEIDYAVYEVTEVAPDSLAVPGERVLLAQSLSAEVFGETGVAGARARSPTSPVPDLAGTVCRHPLDGQGYDFDVPLLPGEHVTVEQGTGLVHTAPGHGSEDFEVGRDARARNPAHHRRRRRVLRPCPPVCRSACLQGRRRGGRRDRPGRQAAGARPAGPFLPAFLALEEAADLPQHAAMVHRHGGERAPAKGAGCDRAYRLLPGIGAQPPRGHDRRPSRLVRFAPTRLGGADHRVRGQEDRRAAARRGRTGTRRGGGRRGGRGRLVREPARTLPRARPRSRRLRAGHRHSRRVVRFGRHPQLHPGDPRGSRLAGLALSRRLGPASRLVPFLAARGLRHAGLSALRGRAHPRLRARRAGPQDVEIARQRGRPPGGHRQVRRRYPAALGGGVRLFRGLAHRRAHHRSECRGLSADPQHAALHARQPRRFRRGRAGAARGDAGAGTLGAAPPATGSTGRCARGSASSTSTRYSRRCTISARSSCRPSISTSARTRSIAAAATIRSAVPRGPCSMRCSPA